MATAPRRSARRPPPRPVAIARRCDWAFRAPTRRARRPARTGRPSSPCRMGWSTPSPRAPCHASRAKPSDRRPCNSRCARCRAPRRRRATPSRCRRRRMSRRTAPGRVIRDLPTSTEDAPTLNVPQFEGAPPNPVFDADPGIRVRYTHTQWGTSSEWAAVIPAAGSAPFQVQAAWQVGADTCVGGSQIAPTGSSTRLSRPDRLRLRLGCIPRCGWRPASVRSRDGNRPAGRCLGRGHRSHGFLGRAGLGPRPRLGHLRRRLHPEQSRPGSRDTR